MDISVHLSKNKGNGIDQIEYFYDIKSLMYVMNCTRLDIVYLVSKRSRFTRNPSIDHWKAVRRVLKYLRYTFDYRL